MGCVDQKPRMVYRFSGGSSSIPKEHLGLKMRVRRPRQTQLMLTLIHCTTVLSDGSFLVSPLTSHTSTSNPVRRHFHIIVSRPALMQSAVANREVFVHSIHVLFRRRLFVLEIVLEGRRSV